MSSVTFALHFSALHARNSSAFLRAIGHDGRHPGKWSQLVAVEIRLEDVESGDAELDQA
jgi:hypothetical protein